MASATMTRQPEQASRPLPQLLQPKAGERPRFYRPELDALRFFAFLGVFLHHATGKSIPLLSSMGSFGLSLFFCLSAFLITELLQLEKERTGTIQIKSFYIRRMLRIWPLYFGFMGLIALTGHIWHTLYLPWALILAYCLLVGNIYTARHGYTYNPVGPLWSISIEEQFYVAWPTLNLLCSRRALAVFSWLLIPSGALGVWYLLRHGATPFVGVWTNTLVEFQLFGAGSLLALALRARVPRTAFPVRVVGALASLLCWAVAARYCNVASDVAGASAGRVVCGYLLASAGAVLLIASGLGLRREHVPAPLVYLGKLSYGLYVLHLLALLCAERCATWMLGGAASQEHHGLFSAVRLTIAFLLTFGAAALSYRFYEKPFLGWKEKFAVIRSRAV